MANQIKVKRGEENNLPALQIGEPAFTTDTKTLYIGSSIGNIMFKPSDESFTTALKSKLDGIATGAEVNQNTFSTIKIDSTNIIADTKTDVFEIAAGTGITLTPDAVNDKVTIDVTSGTYAEATHAHTFDDLSDVTITGPAVGHLLTYNGTSWINLASASIGITATSCTGNAATATKLATPRTINGVSFDGSANININTNPTMREQWGDWTLVANTSNVCTGVNSFTLTLPASPVTGNWVDIIDGKGIWANGGTNNVTIAGNGTNINSLAEDMILDVPNLYIRFIYINATIGWKSYILSA